AGRGGISRQGGDWGLVVVAVVPVVAHPASVDDASKAATMATLIRIRVIGRRYRRWTGRGGRDLPLGFGARPGCAFGGGRFGRVPLCFLMTNTFDVERGCEEEEDHRDGRDCDRGVAGTGQRHPEEDRDGADQREAGEADLGEGAVPQRQENEMDHPAASLVLPPCQAA